MAKRKSSRRSSDNEAGGFRRKALTAAVAAAIAPGIATAGAQYGPNIELRAGAGETGGGDHSRAGVGAAVLYPLPWWQDAHNMPFIDIRGMYFDEGANEVNAGIGYRHMLANERWILGGMFNFDTRESTLGNRYDQVSFGAEALGEIFDARVNYYHVLSDKELIGLDPVGGFFEGNRIFTNGIFEEGMDGVDFEVGALLPFVKQVEARVFAGGYHYDGEVAGDTTGWRLRGEVRPLKNITLVGHVQDDDLFGTAWGIQARWSFGYKMESGHRTLKERMIQFPERDIDVKTTDEVDEGEEGRRISRDREDAQDVSPPSGVFHVDNTAAPGGSGSFEAPFDSVAACSVVFANCGIANAMVFVHQGDGTSVGYDQTFVLAPNQLLIGDGFAGAGAPTFGLGTGIAPRLTAGSPVVVLNNGNEVAGLLLTNDSGAAEVGILGINVTDFDIHDNVIDGMAPAAYSGLAPFGIAGNGIFIATQAGAALPTQANSGLPAPGPGDFSAGSTTTTGVIDNNVVQNVTGDGISLINVAVNGASASQTVSGSNNTVSNVGSDGVEIFNYAGSNHALVYGGAFTPGGGGVASQSVELANTSVTNAEDDGVDIFNYAGPGGTATQTAWLVDTTVTNVDDGINIFNATGDVYNGQAGFGRQEVTVLGATISNTDETGLYIGNATFIGNQTGAPELQQTVTLTDITLQNIDETGIYIKNYGFSNSTVTQNVAIENATVSAANEDGVRVVNRVYSAQYNATGNVTGVQNVSLTNVSVTATDEDGLYFHNAAFNTNTTPAGTALASQTLTLTNVTATANDGFGFFFYNESFTQQNGNQAVAVANQTITLDNVHSSGDEGGFYIRNAGFYRSTATQTVTMNEVSALGSFEEDGFFVQNRTLYQTAIATQSVSIESATSSFNEEDGFRFDNRAYTGGTSTQNLTLSGSGVVASHNDGDGFYFRNRAQDNGSGYATTATQSISLSDAQAIGNEDDGFSFRNDADGQDATANQTATVVNALASANEGNGFYAFNLATEGGQATQTLSLSGEGVLSEFNEDEGFDISNEAQGDDSEARQIVNMTDVRAIGNEDDGFDFDNDSDGADALAEQTLNLTNVVSNFNENDGFDFDNDAEEGGTSTQTVVIDNFEANGNEDMGLYFNNSAFGGSTANQSLTLLNAAATVSGNGDGGIAIRNDGNGGEANQDVQIDTLAVANNDDDENENGTGLRIINDDALSSQSVAITGLTVTGDSSSGVAILNGEGEQTVTINNSNISSNAQHGIYVNNGAFGGGGTQNLDLRNNTITNNAQDGVRLLNTVGGIQSADLRGSQISGNGGDQISADGNATQTVTLPDGTVITDTEFPPPAP